MTQFGRVIGGILLLGVMLIVGDMLSFLVTRRMHKRHAMDLRFLQIKMPRNQSEQDRNADLIQGMKQNLEVMNQVYKNFYAIFSKKIIHRWFGQPCISCEILVEKEVIKFILAVPQDFLETFEKMISSFYAGAVIDEISAPRMLDAGKYTTG